MKLTVEQRSTLLAGINFRVAQFPRAALLAKLRSADEAYHLAKVDGKLATKDPADTQNTSRFAELTNAQVREVVETYSSTYITTYLGNSSIFQMNSPADKIKDAEAFNTIMSEQQKRAGWSSNLSMFFLDIAKYNIAMLDIPWDTQVNYELSAAASGPGQGQNANNLKKVKQVWEGTAINRIDMYNAFFDTSVSPQDLSVKGEWAGTTEIYTQVAFKTLLDKLKSRNGELYLTDANNPQFNIYAYGGSTVGMGASVTNMQHINPDIVPLGQEAADIQKEATDWSQHFGLNQHNQQTAVTKSRYQVSKVNIRVIPSAWGLSTAKNPDDDVEIWTIYILEGNWLLYAEPMDNAHGRLGMVLGQTDADSLGYNSTGPAQVTIPYMKTAKQLLDRALASADRAIGDRALYDHTMFDKDHVDSRIPEAKIATKKTIPRGKSLRDFYVSIPFQDSTTNTFLTDIGAVEEAGRRAAGINKPQTGQFQKGNKTLAEYQDVMSNAADKAFVRSLVIESTVMVEIKYILKLNIIQYQKTATLYNPENRETIDINPAQLYQASVDFKLATALMPTEYQMSPNVQQQMLQLITTAPQLLAEYDIPKILAHILGQGNGLQLEQYKLAGPAGGAGGLPQGPAPQGPAGGAPI